MSTSILFGPTAAAFRHAECIWRALPPRNEGQVEALRIAFEAAVGEPLPDSLELENANLRRSHFTACYNGIFGGGASDFPGEFSLARYGVLLFAEMEHFTPEIATVLAEKLRNPPSDGFPIVLIHSVQTANLPPPLAALPLPRFEVG